VDHIGSLLIKWGNVQCLATYAVEGNHTFNIETLKKHSTRKHGQPNLAQQMLARSVREMKLQYDQKSRPLNQELASAKTPSPLETHKNWSADARQLPEFQHMDVYFDASDSHLWIQDSSTEYTSSRIAAHNARINNTFDLSHTATITHVHSVLHPKSTHKSEPKDIRQWQLVEEISVDPLREMDVGELQNLLRQELKKLPPSRHTSNIPESKEKLLNKIHEFLPDHTVQRWVVYDILFTVCVTQGGAALQIHLDKLPQEALERLLCHEYNLEKLTVAKTQLQEQLKAREIHMKQARRKRHSTKDNMKEVGKRPRKDKTPVLS
jgi:hypothetical protein